MKFTLSLILISFFIIRGEGSIAKAPCSPESPCEDCYDLSSDEAMDIMTNKISVLGDPPYIWEVEKVGYGLTCLDFCPPGDLLVSPGKLKKGKCTYRITNNSDVDMLGECTTIVLKLRAQ